MTNIPQGTTHYQMSISGAFIQNFFKLQDGKWYRWSEWQTWREMTNINEKGAKPDKVTPIEKLKKTE